MYESKRRKRRRVTEHLVEKLNALNMERSKNGKSFPRYYVVNFTSGQMSAITLLMGLGFMAAATLIIKNVSPSGGAIGVLSLVAVVYLAACAVLSIVFAAAFFNAWLSLEVDAMFAEVSSSMRLSLIGNVIEIGHSDKEMHFLVDKIAEAQRAKNEP